MSLFIQSTQILSKISTEIKDNRRDQSLMLGKTKSKIHELYKKKTSKTIQAKNKKIWKISMTTWPKTSTTQMWIYLQIFSLKTHIINFHLPFSASNKIRRARMSSLVPDKRRRGCSIRLTGWMRYKIWKCREVECKILTTGLYSQIYCFLTTPNSWSPRLYQINNLSENEFNNSQISF